MVSSLTELPGLCDEDGRIDHREVYELDLLLVEARRTRRAFIREERKVSAALVLLTSVILVLFIELVVLMRLFLYGLRERHNDVGALLAVRQSLPNHIKQP